MTLDLRDRSPRYGEVAMGSEDRIALSSAADRERVRLLRRPWHDAWWARVAAVAAVIAAVVDVVVAVRH